MDTEPRRSPHDAGGSGLEPFPLVQDRLELDDGLEILGSAGGALDLDQPRQGEAEAGDAEHIDRLAVGQEVSVPSAARDLS